MDERESRLPKREKSKFSKALFLGGSVFASLVILACRTPKAQEQPPPPPSSQLPLISHTPIIDLETCAFHENELIVKFKGESIPNSAQEIFEQYDAKPIYGEGALWLLEVDKEKRDGLEQDLDNDPNVEFTLKNYFEQRPRLSPGLCDRPDVSHD